MSNRISKIRVKSVDYEVRSKRGSTTKTINSLSSIPVDVESIVANISSPTVFSLASNMNKGDHIDLLCIPSSDFQQEISGDNVKTAFGGKIMVKNDQPFKLYINCYDTDKIFIDTSNVEIINNSSTHNVAFNITPPDATVKYSIDSESYNQTTTSNGTVSNVPHGSTIYYKISKDGYETITKSRVVNSDIMVKEEMIGNKYTVTFKVTPSDATVKYSIDSESYNQTTTSNGTVSNVPYGSTIYYKISKTGYGTITKSQVVNNNVTITENMVINKYTVTFKVTPSDATVNYSIGFQTYNQTTTGTGTVSNVPYGSTIYYKISKTGYGTITKSQVVNNNVTITENMVINKYTVTFKVTPSSATVNYSIDSQSYNQTTTGAGTVSVPYGSTIYYKISKAGYGTITRSRVVNSNITVTENMVENDYILVSTNSSGSAKLNKYTNQAGTETEPITIPASSTKYKVDDLIYGFKFNSIDGISITALDLQYLNTSNVTNMSSMFEGCSSLTSITSIAAPYFTTSNVTNMQSMFKGCSSLTSLAINVSNFTTSKVTNMSSMFDGCSSLTSLSLYRFTTSNVTSMWRMFAGCHKLTSITLSNFDTSKVTDMSMMFESCSSLTSLDLSNFDTSKVTDMSEMFSNCSSLTSLDLSNFDTSKVTDMTNMFNNCSSLTSLDLSNFDTSKVTDSTNMFNSCNSLNHIKCKQAFKDWCWSRVSIINLPTAMRYMGSGTWEIVG